MALRNAFGALGLDDTLKDILRMLQTIANKLGQNDSNGRMLVSTQASISVVQSSAAGVQAAWPVTIQSHTGMDISYQSTQAFNSIRSQITVV